MSKKDGKTKDFQENNDAKEDDSMNTYAVERNGHKRLDLESLNFLEPTQASERDVENITPIQWSEEVLSGKRKVVIKK